MKEYQTYMGHETWWNSFRMHLKMYKNIFIILFILDICLVSYLFSRNETHMTTQYPGIAFHSPQACS